MKTIPPIPPELAEGFRSPPLRLESQARGYSFGARHSDITMRHALQMWLASPATTILIENAAELTAPARGARWLTPKLTRTALVASYATPARLADARTEAGILNILASAAGAHGDMADAAKARRRAEWWEAIVEAVDAIGARP